MKLAIWGSTQTGKASLSFNFENYYNLEKIRYKGGVEFTSPNNDNYVIKILYDDRISDVDSLLKMIDDDCTHLFLYRQNLLSQYLSWQHNETLDKKLNSDILDINECKNFINYTKGNTSKIYNEIKHLNLVACSYEELFHSDKVYEIFDKLNIGIKTEDIPHLINPIKCEVTNHVKKEQSIFTVDKGIEHFSYKENYDVIKDIFCEEFMYIDNNDKTVKFLNYEVSH